MGEIVLDDLYSNNWVFDSKGKKFGLYDLPIKPKNNGYRYCNIFAEHDIYADRKGTYGIGVGYMRIHQFVESSSVTEFKEFLRNTPVIIQYELASPVIEEVETDYTRLMLESYENATVYFNSHIPPVSTIRYQANVISTAEIMSVNDEQDSMIIDNATQIAMINLTM